MIHPHRPRTSLAESKQTPSSRAESGAPAVGDGAHRRRRPAPIAHERKGLPACSIPAASAKPALQPAQVAEAAQKILSEGGPADATGKRLLALTRDAGGAAMDSASLGRLVACLPVQPTHAAVLLGAWVAAGAGATGAEGRLQSCPWALRLTYALQALPVAELERIGAYDDGIRLPENLRLGACLLHEPVTTLLDNEPDPGVRLMVLASLCRIPGAMDATSLDAALRECALLAASHPADVLAMATVLVREAPATAPMGRLAALRSALMPALLRQDGAGPQAAATPPWEAIEAFYAAGARRHGASFIEADRAWLRLSADARPLLARLETVLDAAAAQAQAPGAADGEPVARRKARDDRSAEPPFGTAPDPRVVTEPDELSEADLALKGSLLGAIGRLRRPFPPSVLGELARRVREHAANTGRASPASLFGLIAQQASAPAAAGEALPEQAIEALMRQVFGGPPFLQPAQMQAAWRALRATEPFDATNSAWLSAALQAAQQACNAAVAAAADGKSARALTAGAAYAHMESIGNTLKQMALEVLWGADAAGRREVLRGLIREAALQEVTPGTPAVGLIAVLRTATMVFEHHEVIDIALEATAKLPAVIRNASLCGLAGILSSDGREAPHKLCAAAKHLLRALLADETASTSAFAAVADGLCNPPVAQFGPPQLLTLMQALSDLRSSIEGRGAQGLVREFLARVVRHVFEWLDKEGLLDATAKPGQGIAAFPRVDDAERRRILALLRALSTAPSAPGPFSDPETLVAIGQLLQGDGRADRSPGSFQALLAGICASGLAPLDTGHLLLGALRHGGGTGVATPAELAVAVRVIASRPLPEAALLCGFMYLAFQRPDQRDAPSSLANAWGPQGTTPAQLRQRVLEALRGAAGGSGDAPGLPPGIALGLELAENPLAAVRGSGLGRAEQLALLRSAWGATGSWCPATVEDLVDQCTTLCAEDPDFALEAAIRLLEIGTPRDSVGRLFDALAARLVPQRLTRMVDLLEQLRARSTAPGDWPLGSDPKQAEQLARCVRDQARRLLETEAARESGAALRERLEWLSLAHHSRIDAVFDATARMSPAGVQAAAKELAARLVRELHHSPRELASGIRHLLQRALEPASATATLQLEAIAEGLSSQAPPGLGPTAPLMWILDALSGLRDVIDQRNAHGLARGLLDLAAAHAQAGYRNAGAPDGKHRGAAGAGELEGLERRRVLSLLPALAASGTSGNPPLDAPRRFDSRTLILLGHVLHVADRFGRPPAGMGVLTQDVCDTALGIGETGCLLIGLVRGARGAAIGDEDFASTLRVLAARPQAEAALLTCFLHVAHQPLRVPGAAPSPSQVQLKTVTQLRERIESALRPGDDAPAATLPPGIALGLQLAERPLQAARGSGLPREQQLQLLAASWGTVAGLGTWSLAHMLGECTPLVADDPDYALDAAIRLVQSAPGGTGGASLEGLFKALVHRLTPGRIGRMTDLLEALHRRGIGPSDEPSSLAFIHQAALELLASDAGRAASTGLRHRLRSLSEA